MDMDAANLEAKYTWIPPEEAEVEWTAAYSQAFHHCIHGHDCRHGSDCTVRCGGPIGIHAPHPAPPHTHTLTLIPFTHLLTPRLAAA